MNRRRLRLVLIAVVVLVAVTAAGLIALPEIVRRVVIRSVAASTGRVVTLDAAEVQLVRGRLALRGLRVIDRDGGPLATLDRLEIRFRPRALLGAHVRLHEVTVDAPVIRIVRTGPNTFNVSDLMGGTQTAAGPTRVRITLERLQLRGGAVSIEDRTVTPARTARIGASALLDDGAGTVDIDVDGAPLKIALAEVRLTPLHVRAVVKGERLPVALAGLVLPPDGPAGTPSGTVDVSATIEHDATTGTVASADAAFAGIELWRYNTAFVTAPSARVIVDDARARAGVVSVGSVRVDGGTVTLADAQLGTTRRWRVEGLLLEATRLSSARDAAPGIATASARMAGARVSMWAGNIRLAPLAIDATTIVRDVDVALLRAYLPPAVPVVPERGVVNATLRLVHDATAGTRLDLDAGLTGVELQRPGHFVGVPSARVQVENVVLAGDAVTVGHVAVGSERVTLEERGVKPVRTWVVQNVAVDARDLSTRRDAVQGVATARAKVAGATISTFITGAKLDPLELYATAILRDVDLGLLRLYLPDEALVDFQRGTVNATIQVDHATAEGMRLAGDATLAGMEARGRWQLSTVSLSAPAIRLTITDARRRGANVSVGRVEVSGNGSLVDSRGATSRVDVAQLRAATEGLTWPVSAPARVEVSARFGDRSELDVSGTAALAAPLPKIAWTTDLTVAFRRVDLTPLAVYVPEARGFGGRVQADVTATVAYDGTLTARVRGDVAGGRFALTDGDKTLVSLRRIDLKGLDAQWPEKIAIEQVRLRQPFALFERDVHGRLLLLDRFTPPVAAEAAPLPATGEVKSKVVPVTVGEVMVEEGSAAFVYATPSGRALKTDIPRVVATARDVTWPSTKPARVSAEISLAEGGSVKIDGGVGGQPLAADLNVVLARAELRTISPWLPFRARLRGRIDGTLAVAGPVSPARLTVRGDAGVRGLEVADGQTPVITVETIDVAGIDAVWPERITLDRVRVGRSWALLERDREGSFRLQTLFMQPGEVFGPPSPGSMPLPGAPPPDAPAPPIALTVRELIVEHQSATVVDAAVTPPAKLEIADARLTVRDLSWPPKGPMKADLASPMPGGGTVTASGTLELAPVRIEARVKLDGVSLDPARPYLPIEGKVAGQMTGEVALKLALEPLSIQATGHTELRRFQLDDGDRPVVTVGRMDVSGIDVDWPRKIAVERVMLRRPRLLVERDALGEIRLWRVAVPQWNRVGTGATSADGPAPAAPQAPSAATETPPAATPPVIEVASFVLERASARFVDQSTTPTFAEELSNVDMNVTPVTTKPGERTRFTASGAIGGGTFKARCEAEAGERTRVALTVEIKDYVVPRANPYLDLYTGWTATRGTLTITGNYALDGTRLETRHDVVVRGIHLEPVDTRDEVERRVGLPFGLLVSLLKDSRGVISLSVPVAVDLATRTFEFQDALWSAVRTLSLRLVALPFSKIGSLFVSGDSKVEAVTIAPVTFEPGTDRLTAETETHLQKIAGFLKDTPAVGLELQAIFTRADVDALKAPGDPSEPLRALGEQRFAAVRTVLERAGIDGGRVRGRVPRRPLIEGAGAARVELNPRPVGELSSPPSGRTS